MNTYIAIVISAWLLLGQTACRQQVKKDSHNHGAGAQTTAKTNAAGTNHKEAHAHEAHGDAHAEAHGEHDHANEEPNTAHLTAAQIKSIALQTGTIAQKNLSQTLKANGILKVPNQNRANVHAVLGGTIESILVQPGAYVKAGQAIARVSNMQLIGIQEEFLATTAKIKYAQLELKRQQELNAGNAGTLKNLQIIESELQQLTIRQAALQAQLKLAGVSTNGLTSSNIQSRFALKSPINGTISNINVSIGENISNATIIASIIDNSKLHVDLFVFERDIASIKMGQSVHFELTNLPGKSYDATIFSISNTFEEGSKAIIVHANVKGNISGLFDGMGVNAIVSLKEAAVSAVPSEAVVNYQGEDFIFIVKAKEDGGMRFEKIPVIKGVSQIGFTAITPLVKLSGNVEVVEKGAFFVLSKMTNAGEHVH